MSGDTKANGKNVEKVRKIGSLTVMDAIAKYMSQGTSMADVAKKAGVSRQRVSQVFRDYGIDGRKKRASDRYLTKSKKEPRPETRNSSGFWSVKHKAWMRAHRYPDGTRATLRTARSMAINRVGRKLRKDEYVILADGNPHNLSSDNIIVMSPSAAKTYSLDRLRKRVQ